MSGLQKGFFSKNTKIEEAAKTEEEKQLTQSMQMEKTCKPKTEVRKYELQQVIPQTYEEVEITQEPIIGKARKTGQRQNPWQEENRKLKDLVNELNKQIKELKISTEREAQGMWNLIREQQNITQRLQQQIQVLIGQQQTFVTQPSRIINPDLMELELPIVPPQLPAKLLPLRKKCYKCGSQKHLYRQCKIFQMQQRQYRQKQEAKKQAYFQEQERFRRNEKARIQRIFCNSNKRLYKIKSINIWDSFQSNARPQFQSWKENQFKNPSINRKDVKNTGDRISS